MRRIARRAGVLGQPMRRAAYVFALLIGLAGQAGAQAPAPGASPPTGATAASSPAATTLSDFARSRVDAMLRGGHADPGWFAANFLTQVAPAQVDSIVAKLKADLGAYQSTDGTQGDYTAHFTKGTDEVTVHLDGDDKIDGLFFKPPKLQTSSLGESLAALRAAKGSVSYVVVEGRSERAALDASDALAVGSAFKLAVLAAVTREVQRRAPALGGRRAARRPSEELAQRCPPNVAGRAADQHRDLRGGDDFDQ